MNINRSLPTSDTIDKFYQFRFSRKETPDGVKSARDSGMIKPHIISEVPAGIGKGSLQTVVTSINEDGEGRNIM